MLKASFRMTGAPTAVVTGAAGGLGSALCQALRARGWTAVGTDVALGPGATEVLDVRDAAACRALAQRLQPSLWINNAGILAAGSAAAQPDDEIKRCIEVNLLGTINGSRAAADVMRNRGSGQILNVGSLASWIPVPGETVYAATKHGVRAFTEGFAAELRGTGVAVSMLAPDGIWTPMLHDKLSDPHAAMSFTGIRLLDAAEVADAAMRLLDSGALMRSVPRGRGAQVRLLSATPGLWLRLIPVLTRIGAVNQWSLRRKENRGQEQALRG